MTHNLKISLNVLKFVSYNFAHRSSRVLYSTKWMHRKPSRIVNETKIDSDKLPKLKLNIERQVLKERLLQSANNVDSPISSEPNDSASVSYGDSLSESSDKPVTEVTGKKKKGQAKTNVIDEEKKRKESARKLGVPVFEKLGQDDRKLSNLLTDIKARKNNNRTSVLLEGKRLILDAMSSGIIPHHVFFTRIRDLQDLQLPEEGVKVYKICYNTLSVWSDLKTSPGMIAIAQIPCTNMKKPSAGSLPLTIICDNIRDPGNLGNILRTSASVGCEKIILTKGCVDLWGSNVLRSGAGSHFRIPIHYDIDWKDVPDIVGETSSYFLADSNLKLKKKQMSECNISDKVEKYSNEEGVSNKYLEQSCMFPVVPYYSFNYCTQASLALIIGGETLGLSEDAFNLMIQKKGVRLHVSLNNNVESLNVGTALGVIAFEMKKQFCVNIPKLGREECDVISGEN